MSPRECKGLRPVPRHHYGLRVGRTIGVGVLVGRRPDDARFVVAREWGFDNWPRLRVAVQAADVPPDRRVHAFLECSGAWGDWQRAQALLALQPDLARADLYAACVLGAADEVAGRLARRPELARTGGGARQWPPLLYVRWSAFLARDPGRSDGLRTTRVLLDHGADPNCCCRNPEDDVNESALYGSCGVANHARLTELLLDAGADPDLLFSRSTVGSAAETGTGT